MEHFPLSLLGFFYIRLPPGTELGVGPFNPLRVIFLATVVVLVLLLVTEIAFPRDQLREFRL